MHIYIYIYNISYFPTTKSFRFLPENRIIINKYIYIYISNNILFILLFTFFFLNNITHNTGTWSENRILVFRFK